MISRRPSPRVILLLALAGGVGIWAWYRSRREAPPPVPEIRLEGAQPEVASVILEAQARIRDNPRDVAAWSELTYLLIANGFYDPALPALDQIRKLDPENPTWPYLQASLGMLLSKPKLSLEGFESAYRLARNAEEKASILFYWAQVQLEQGRLAEAGRSVDELQELERDSPRAHFAVGLHRVAIGDREGARKRLSLLVEHPSARKQVHALLASLEQENPMLAEQHRNLSTRLPQDVPWPSSFDHRVRERRVQTSTGLEAFDDFTLSGRHDEALEFLKSHSIDHPSETVFLLLGQSHIRKGEFEFAERAFRRCLEYNAKNEKAKLLLATSLLELGESLRAANRRPEAEAKFLEVIALMKPKPPEVASTPVSNYLTARANRRLNRLADAEAAYRAAALMAPDMYEAHLGLGETLGDLNRFAEAIKSLENAVKTSPPNNDEAQKLLLSFRSRLGKDPK